MRKKNPQYNKDFWMFKAPMSLKREFDKIRIERIKSGKDKELQTYSRIGLAIARHEKLLKDLVKADFVLGDEK